MATVQVTGIKNAKDRLNYLQEEAHYTDDYVQSRNSYIGGNVEPEMADGLFAKLNRFTHSKNQAYQIIQSFSIDEFDYKNYDPKRANELGCELAEQVLQDKGVNAPYIVFTQADGKGHHVHNHILLCNFTDKGKTIPHGLSFFKVRDINDGVMTGAQSSVQPKLINSRNVDNADRQDPLTGKYGKSHKHKTDRQIKTDDLRSDVMSAIDQSRNREELIRNLELLNIQIVKRREDDDPFYAKNGKLKQSINLYRDGIKRRSKTLTGLSLEQIEKRLKKNAEREVTASNALREEQTNRRRQKRLRNIRQEQSQANVSKFEPPKKRKQTVKEFEKQLEEKSPKVQLEYWRHKLNKLIAKGKNDNDKSYHEAWQKTLQLRELVADEQSQRSVNATQYTSSQYERDDGPSF